MKATYRDLKVCAVIDDKVSPPFYVKQNASAPKVDRLVLRLDQGKPNQKGEDQINTNNLEYRVFGNQRKAWINDKLAGFRRTVGEVTCIVVEVIPHDIPTEDALKGLEVF
jgi:hypothetical protein